MMSPCSHVAQQVCTLHVCIRRSCRGGGSMLPRSHPPSPGLVESPEPAMMDSSRYLSGYTVQECKVYQRRLFSLSAITAYRLLCCTGVQGVPCGKGRGGLDGAASCTRHVWSALHSRLQLNLATATVLYSVYCCCSCSVSGRL